MSHSKIRPVSLLPAIALLVIVAGLPLNAQPACVSLGDLTFCPQGQAEAAVNAAGSGVEITNLSLTGDDGALVELTGSGSPVVDVSYNLILGQTALAKEGYLQIDTRGPIEGREGTIIRSTLWASDEGIYAAVDFPDLPPAQTFFAVVEDDSIVALHDDLEDGHKVHIRPLSGSGRSFGAVGAVRGLRGAASPLVPLNSEIPKIDLSTICPMAAAPPDLFGICALMPCGPGEIELLQFTNPVFIDLVNPENQVVETYEASGFMLGRDATVSVRRGPFTAQEVTGAGLGGFAMEEMTAGAIAH